MKKMIAYVVLGAAVSSGVLWAARLGAEPARFRRERPATVQDAQARAMRFLEDVAGVSVTDEQKTQILAIVAKYWERTTPLLGKLRASRKEFRDTIRKEPLDEEGIRSAIHARAGVVADLAIMRGKMRAEIREVLTPEQREKVKAARKRVEEGLKSLTGMRGAILG